jgi:hypothetical protein
VEIVELVVRNDVLSVGGNEVTLSDVAEVGEKAHRHESG